MQILWRDIFHNLNEGNISVNTERERMIALVVIHNGGEGKKSVKIEGKTPKMKSR